MTSALENAVLEEAAKFEGFKELLEDDLEDSEPANVLENIRLNLDELKKQYLSLKVAQSKFKNKLLSSVSEADFNGINSPHKYTDAWLNSKKQEYQAISKTASAFLRKHLHSEHEEKEGKAKVNTYEDISKIAKKITLESQQVEIAVTDAYTSLHEAESINLSQANIYNELKSELMDTLDVKIPNLINSMNSMAGPDQREQADKIVADFEILESKLKPKLYGLIRIIAEKTSHSGHTVSDRTSLRPETIHLKKTDPPVFSGKEEDYPEFHRKWLAIVAPARLPEEAELDRLREALPDTAEEMLIGVTKLTTAWGLLKSRYGNEDLIAVKLKNELKAISFSACLDHDKIINLTIKVRSIVSRLTQLKSAEALKHDGEFIAAVYFQLPDRFKQEWLKFDKSTYETKWSALIGFLEESYNKAVEEKLLLATLNQPSGHAGLAAAVINKDVTNEAETSEQALDRDAQRKRKYEEARLNAGKCPVCHSEHTFRTRWSNMQWPSDRLITCKKFNDMSSKQRAETIESLSGCPRCTSWRHKKADCTAQIIDCKELINGVVCHKDHSRLVCNSGVAYCLSTKTDSIEKDIFQPTLHYLQDIKINSDSSLARIFWDDGSNRVLIDNGFAAEHKLKSKTSTVTMKVVGGQYKKVKTKIYELDLVDRLGHRHSIWGYGMEKIIEPDDPVDLGPVRSLFPHIPDEVFSPMPKRRIDILMGLNFNSLHPCGGSGRYTVGNLRALQSKFGTGWVIGGCHENLKTSPVRLTAEAATARVAKVSVIPEFEVNKLDIYKSSPAFARICIDPVLTPEFWESDSMGILPPRKCIRCKQCALKGDCSEGHLVLTLKEEAELNLIRDNIKIIDGQVHVAYPFIKNPNCLSNNRPVVIKIAQRLWQSLKRDGLLETYNEEIEKYLQRGTFVELSQEEIDSYEGPHQYIVHHAVLKDSKTTPCRVVTNSSFNNGGHSLNSCLPKGPNSLNSMLEITLRFRCHEVAFMYDLSKAYNSMRTGIIERHLRRFVWRNSETEAWRDYAIDRVHFGDQSAACQLEVSKELVANLGACISEDAARIIKEDTYVDDGASGGSVAEVDRLVGIKDDDGNYNGEISQVLNLGGFKIKEFIVEGDSSQSDSGAPGNSLFGYSWDPKIGLLHVKLSINMSKKVRSVRSLPDLTIDDIKSLSEMKMTKRLLLGVANSFGDFLGITAPYTVRLKLLMKKLYEQELPVTWDEDIPSSLRSSWIDLISEALVSTQVTFPRSVRPVDAVGGPRIVAFGDGAFAAFAAAVYVVWEVACLCEPDLLSRGHFSSSLLCAKSRVTPLNGYTIPRSDMSGDCS